jgi:hypothetical protein
MRGIEKSRWGCTCLRRIYSGSICYPFEVLIWILWFQLGGAVGDTGTISAWHICPSCPRHAEGGARLGVPQIRQAMMRHESGNKPDIEDDERHVESASSNDQNPESFHHTIFLQCRASQALLQIRVAALHRVRRSRRSVPKPSTRSARCFLRDHAL